MYFFWNARAMQKIANISLQNHIFYVSKCDRTEFRAKIFGVVESVVLILFLFASIFIAAFSNK